MEKVDAAEVAAYAKALRAADGLTQRQLAERIGCKHGVVCLMEKGVIRSNPAARRLLALRSEALDVI